MWFKQLRFFILPKNNNIEISELEEALSQHIFLPVDGLSKSSEGFVPAFSFTNELVFSVDKSHRITLKKQEKIIPTSAVNDLLAQKISEIQLRENRDVGRREKKELKENIFDDLLPRALSKSTRTQLIWNQKHQMLLVDSANANRAENILSHLREALGGLDAKLPNTVISPTVLMTQWLSNGFADGFFQLNNSCELKSEANDNKAVIRISGQDLSCDEVITHLKKGKFVSQLGLVWKDKISFVLSSDFSLKRICFLDEILEEVAENGEDAESIAATSQILISENLCELVEELIVLLGGLTSK